MTEGCRQDEPDKCAECPVRISLEEAIGHLIDVRTDKADDEQFLNSPVLDDIAKRCVREGDYTGAEDDLEFNRILYREDLRETDEELRLLQLYGELIVRSCNGPLQIPVEKEGVTYGVTVCTSPDIYAYTDIVPARSFIISGPQE